MHSASVLDKKDVSSQNPNNTGHLTWQIFGVIWRDLLIFSPYFSSLACCLYGVSVTWCHTYIHELYVNTVSASDFRSENLSLTWYSISTSVVLFPLKRNFTPYCLSLPWCINESLSTVIKTLQNNGGKLVMDWYPTSHLVGATYHFAFASNTACLCACQCKVRDVWPANQLLPRTRKQKCCFVRWPYSCIKAFGLVALK